MSTDLNRYDVELPAEEQPLRVRRGHPILAWIIILAVVTFIVFIGLFVRPSQSDDDDSTGTVLMLVQSRYFVGAASLLGNNQDLKRHVQALNTGPVDRRFLHVVLVGELDGADQALKELDELENRLAANRIDLTREQQRTKTILEHLYGDIDRGRKDLRSVKEPDREFLRERLGWFGELALAPAGGKNPAEREAVLAGARQTTIAVLAAFIIAGLAGLAGLIGLGILVVLAATGSLQSGFGPRSPHGGIYAETFALWMVLFLILSLGAALLPIREGRLLLEGIAIIFSLSALAWPVLRGIPWRQVRQDIGLTGGRVPILEPFIGLISYPMAIPPLAIGLLITLVLILVATWGQPAVDLQDRFTTEGMPAHPIVGLAKDAGAWGYLQILFLASVVAPIVEETMFRGVLYRHLRDATFAAGTLGSSIASATIVSFIFAVVHPQGLLAVPALMALACAFTLIREWRGTLIPCMIAHALNNGIIFSLLILAIG
jgi:membrane protease YdiL (CAAX protease family)